MNEDLIKIQNEIIRKQEASLAAANELIKTYAELTEMLNEKIKILEEE